MTTGITHFFDEARFLSGVGGISGATVSFYYTGTTNLAPIYTNKTLSSPMTNPVVIAQGAIVPNIFLDPAITYRRRIVYSDASVQDVDPIFGLSVQAAVNVAKTPSGSLQDTATAVDALSTGSGSGGVSHTDAGTGAQVRTIATILKEAPINLHDYYQSGDGSNWAPAFNRAVAQMAATKRAIYIPPPTGGLTYYPMTSNISLDLQPFASTGLNIFGSGQQKSSFDFRGLTANNFLIRCSGGTPPAGTPASCAYIKISDIGMIGNASGPLLAVGNPDLSDQINELVLSDVNIQNFNVSSLAVGAQFNAVYNANVSAVINCGSGGYVGGMGDAVQMISTAFSTFQGSYGSAQKSFHLTGSGATGSGFNYGNVFLGCDMENVAYCIVQDHAASTRNTWIGGQFSYSTNGVHSPTGGRLLLVNPNVNPSGGATLANFVGSNTGVLIKGSGYTPTNLPTLAATTVAMTNNTGHNLFMFLAGGTVTGINRNGGGVVTWATNSMEFWPAGETRALTYSSAPTLTFSTEG